MCGRITLTSKPSRLPGLEGSLHFEFWPGPRYNIAPTESVATILNDGSTTVRFKVVFDAIRKLMEPPPAAKKVYGFRTAKKRNRGAKTKER